MFCINTRIIFGGILTVFHQQREGGRELERGLNILNNLNMEKLFQGKRVAAVVLLVIMVIVAGGLVQESKAHSCGSTFFSALVELIPCRASVAPFSPIPPSESCCNAVKALGQPCLCVLVNGPPISGVDRNMAMQLPDKCTTNFEPCELMK